MIHPSVALRNRELEALTITAEIVVGFGIKDRGDIQRIRSAVFLLLEKLDRDPARERVLKALGLGEG